MVTVETIGRIRRAFLVDHKPIRQIVRELRVSRKTVRKAVRGSSTEFRYERQAQPQPRLGEFVARLDANCWRRTASGRHASVADGAAVVRAAACRGIPGRLRQRAASCARLASRPIAAGRGLHPAVVRAGRSLPIRLVARGGWCSSGVTTTIKRRPHPTVPQPDVPGASLSTRDPGDGVRRARPRLPPVWRGVPSRDL